MFICMLLLVHRGNSSIMVPVSYANRQNWQFTVLTKLTQLRVETVLSCTVWKRLLIVK